MSDTVNFYALAARMRHIRRWCLMRSLSEENLLEHSCQTAIIAHALALIENRLCGASLDAGLVAAAALFHDTPEVLTGDMPTPVKYRSEDLKTAYKRTEREAAEEILAMLPDFLREDYARLFNLDRNGLEYRIVKAADKISAYIKCLEETSSGNPEFRVAMESAKREIDGTDIEAVRYFMDNCMEGFSKPLDELR